MFKKLIISFLIGFLLSSCNNSTDNVKDTSKPSSVNTIAAIAPSIVEILLDLGLGENIVAIDTNSVLFEGLNEDVSVFDMLQPDGETLALLNPDLVLVTDMAKKGGSEDPYKQMSNMGINVIYIPTANSIDEIKEYILYISELTDTVEKGKDIVDNMEKEINRIKSITNDIEDKKTVYFEIAAAPSMYTFGKNVFINEMLEVVGTKNIFEEQDGWIPATEESVVLANPDVIITSVDYIENPIEEIKSRSGWAQINAVKNNDVYYISTAETSVPTQSVIKGLNSLLQVIYPEL